MKRNRFPLLLSLLFCSCFSLFTACWRTPISLVPSNIPLSQNSYQELGRVSAEDCGAYIFGIIPMGEPASLEKAMKKAMAVNPKARALVNITISEYFAYAIIGSTSCTQIEATAVYFEKE